MPGRDRLTNFESGPWRDVSRESGIRTVECSDFESFCAFVNRGFGDGDCEYLWRGQRDATWPIQSSLARTGKVPFTLLSDYRNAVARCTHVEYAIGGTEPSAEEARLRLWSLGQHHGLVTPLIDWTVYPYVALFFAFAESTESEHRAVFALDWSNVATANFQIGAQINTFTKKINNPPLR